MNYLKPFIGSVLIFFMTIHVLEIQAVPNADIVLKKQGQKPTADLIMEEGITYYLELERVVDHWVVYKLADKLESPFKTIIVKFEHDIMYGTVFTIVNPFKKKLDYRIRRKGVFAEYTDNIELPMASGTFQKGWPGEFINSIIISNLRLRE